MSVISIVVPVFNRWAYTKKCIGQLSLLNKDTHEIIIIDNASSDETKNELPALCDKISNSILIRNETNLGHSVACNQGYNKAKGDIVCFLNNDIKIYQNNWTDNISKYLTVNNNHLIGASGGFVDPTNQFQFKYETKDQATQINYLGGWCLAGTKIAFDKLIIDNAEGPWNPSFFFYYNDTDLGFRATQNGIELKVIDLPLGHIGKVSVSQLNTFRLYNEGRQQFLKNWSKR